MIYPPLPQPMLGRTPPGRNSRFRPTTVPRVVRVKGSTGTAPPSVNSAATAEQMLLGLHLARPHLVPPGRCERMRHPHMLPIRVCEGRAVILEIALRRTAAGNRV